MTAPAYDPAQAALAELAASGCPAPDDLIEGMTPLARLLFLHELAYEVMARWASDAAELLDLDESSTAPVARAIQALGMAGGALDEACVAMAILPAEAVAPAGEGVPAHRHPENEPGRYVQGVGELR